MRQSKQDAPKPDLVLWRYLDFPKFVSLLESSSLFFSRLDLLGDPFEGSSPSKDIEESRRMWRQMSWESGTPIGLYEDFYSQRDYDPRKDVYVSCWHINESENAAMWRLYSEQKKGVALKTRVTSLVEQR